MGLLQRVARVYAQEGLGGVGTRLARRILPGRRPVATKRQPDAARAAAQAASQARAAERAEAELEYARQRERFDVRVRELGCADEVAHFYWYHAIDLGNGLITPGDYDYRAKVATFPFPADMRGMTVLDVGSATGFFAFEFERRGAEVTSVELPSLADWDILSTERPAVLDSLMKASRSDTLEEAYHKHLDGPFQFCRRRLGSKVQRCYSSVYDLTPAKVGRDRFDIVYAGNILMHLFSPFEALDVLAGLCKNTLIATIGADDGRHDAAMTLHKSETRAWWGPNQACMEHMLSRLGFASVRCTCRDVGWLRRAWHHYRCDFIQADRTPAAA